MTNFSRHI